MHSVIVALLLNGVLSQDDGNPHKWDRNRRCDHAGYSPKCGPCEGVGGICWSDNKNDITIAPCEVVATAEELDLSALVRPVWGPIFTESASHEILIGKKTDAACFQAFPGNVSTGTNCYKPQEIKIYSDMLTKKALVLKANQGGNAWGIFGNVSSTIYHQGPNMWILNKLPLGITQTVCASPREGADASQPVVNPVQFNWTDNLVFVARESIEVEYGVGKLTLDHYGFGPHHAWVDPKTGIIVRMWQPYNGLQIFTPGTWTGSVDPEKFSELSSDGSTAPKAAQKDGSTFRIKCGDDGFPEQSSSSVSAGDLFQLAEIPNGDQKASRADLRRAHTKVPRSEYKGDGFDAMSRTLNGWLLKHAPNSKECEEWTVEELQHLQVYLLLLRDPSLNSIYKQNQDNRHLKQEVKALAAEWEELNRVAAADPSLARMHRDGHCHEAVMWYVHHLPEDIKTGLRNDIALPLLSYMRHDLETPTPEAAQIKNAYEEKVTCASCHSNVFPSKSSDLLI